MKLLIELYTYFSGRPVPSQVKVSLESSKTWDRPQTRQTQMKIESSSQFGTNGRTDRHYSFMSSCQSQNIHETFQLHYNFRCPSVLKSLFPLIGTMGKLEDLKFSGWMKQNHPYLSCVRIILDHSKNSLSYFIFLKFWKINQSILMEYGHYASTKTKITICGTNGILFACLWI